MLVDMVLVELISHSVPYDELVGYFEYSDEEIQNASRFFTHTSPEDLLEMMEENEWLHQEEANW